MPMNRVQYQPGLSHGDFLRSSLPQFLRHCETEAVCERALMKARWPRGFVCDRCAGTAHSTFARNGQHCWQCSGCRHQTRTTCSRSHSTPDGSFVVPFSIFGSDESLRTAVA